MSHNGQAERTTKRPQSERLSAAFADSLRLNILSECNRREMSPRSFHREVGGATLPRIVRAFELLAQYEWLERTHSEEADVEEVERFYRSTGAIIVEEEDWGAMPDSNRALVVGRVFEGLMQRARRAMKEGTIAVRADAHLTWTPLELDRQGWHEAIGRLNSLFRELDELERRAKARLAENGEESIAMTVGLLGFESPREGPKGS